MPGMMIACSLENYIIGVKAMTGAVVLREVQG